MNDLQSAFRQMLKSPGFTAVAVLTLALAIGANTAIFSVVDGVLLRPAPFEQIDRLMMVWETDRKSGTIREPASLPDYLDLEERSRTFGELAGFNAEAVTLTGVSGDPVRLAGISSTSGFMPLLGIEPLLGRTFSERESAPGGDKVVLIAEGLWDRLYARDPGVLGGTLHLDGDAHRIIGVVPDEADFGILQVLNSAAYAGGFADRGGQHDVAVWMPLQKSVDEWPRSTHPMFVVGRLAPAASLAAAQQEMTSIAANLEASFAVNADRGIHVEPLADVIFSEVRPALLLLLAAVGLVLLVAAANVANLLLARAGSRNREVAVRASLGADGRRLARQFMVEGLLLSFVGATLGTGLAVVGTDALLALAPADVPRLDTVGINARILALTLAVSIVVGTGFGLVPTLKARRIDLQSALRSESGVAETGSARRGLLQSGIVIAELALAVVLVVGAGLLLKSFWQIQRVDPGFTAEGVMKAEFQLPGSRYPVDFSVWPDFEEAHRFNAALLDRADSLPGVESAAIAIAHPMERGYTNSFEIVGSEAGSKSLPEISIRSVSPGYFGTVRLALRSGRVFDSGDATNAPAVAVINEAAAQLAFPDRDPIGQSISFWGTERRITGVVANEKFHGLTAPAPMAVYTPIAQTPSVSGAEALLVRANGNPDALAPLLRSAILEIDPQLAVFGVEPLGATVGRTVAQQRFTMLLLAIFAAVAVVLAIIGVHGVLSYIVSRRTSEMGVRMALGARRIDVGLLVAAQTVRLAIAGLVFGLAAALASARLFESLLYGVTATDPATFAAVAALVFAVAMLAALAPVRRATAIEPVEALRHD